jgi:hypothetical protein
MFTLLRKYFSITASVFFVLAEVPLANSAPCIPPPTGLVSWWRGESNALDSIDGNNGTLQNGAGFSSGEVGNGFNLDGINDYVLVNASSKLNVGLGSGFTIEGWIKPTTVAYQMPIAEFERVLGTFNGADVGVHFYISVPPSGGTGPGCFYANIKGANGADHQLATGAGLVASNVWQHVALSYDKASGMAAIYLNGAVAVQANIGSFTPQTSFKLLFGARTTFGSASSPSDRFSGKMDELSMYSRALTTAEIQAIYIADGAGKCAPTPPTCVTPPAGLVSWWKAESNALDSVSSNNGILRNGPAYAGGMVGSAFRFAGANDCVEVPYSTNLVPSTFSVETWVEPSSQVSDPINQDLIFGQGYGHGSLVVRTGTTGVRVAWLFGTSHFDFYEVASANEIPIGQFSHLVGTWDGTTLRLYINGVLNAQSTPGASPVDSGCSFFIGGFYSPAADSCNYVGQFFNGTIDELSFYSRALSSNEVASIYNADGAGKCVPTLPPSCTPPPSGLVSWWKGESNALDSVDGNNGTLQGGVTFAAGEVGQTFNFNGSNSYVEVPDSASLRLTNTLTIEFWVKRQQIAGRPYGDIIVEKGGDWTGGAENYGVGIATAGYGDLFQFFFAGGNRGCGNINDLNWHHCAVVAHNGDVDPTFYLDGVQQPVTWRQGASTINLYPSTRPLHIGAQIDPTFNYYSDTLIDELSIYSRVLSAAEIQAIYNAGSTGKCVPAIAPVITAQPINQTVTVGGTATFTVGANGTPPLSYQWYFNGTSPVAGGTNTLLTLTNVQLSQGGLYSVVVSNAINSAASSNALLTVNVPNCSAPPAGLVSWWKGESNALDSVDGHNGTLQGGVAFAAGEVSKAFNFNGSNSYVEVPDSPSLRLTNTLTIEFWVKRQQIVGRPYGDIVVEKGGDWTGGVENYGVGIATAGYGDLFQFFFAGGNRGCGNLNDLNWHHCAVVAHNGDVDPTFYLDGVQQPVTWRQGASTINLYPSTRPLHIGAQIDPSFIYYSDTLVDELSIYNRALTATEIQAIYHAGSNGKCAGTVTAQTGVSMNLVFGPVIDNGDFVVHFAGIPGLTYTIESAADLDGPWSKAANIIVPITDTGLGVGVFEFREPIGTNPTRFYRTVYPGY